MIVVKYGGHAMVNADLAESFATDIVSLVNAGERVIVVHGGGPQIDQELKARNLTWQTVTGLRATTPEMMDVIEMVLTGRVLREVTNSIIQAGGMAVGITGRDGATLMARKIRTSALGEVIDVGQVGEIHSVDTRLLQTLLGANFIPVIAPVSADENGVAYNVNADSAAGAIAGALHVDRAIFLTDVPGLLRHWPDPTSLIDEISYVEAKQLLPTLSDGMVPKIAACLHAIECGAKAAQIIDGRELGALSKALSTHQGTVITS